MNLIYRYFHYLLKATNKHQIHSPFVYNLYTNIIKEDNSYYLFQNIESVRSKMLLSKEKIEVTDYGTGISKKRSLRLIAKNSLKSAKSGRLLFRMVNHFQPQTILELGTSLGITSSYLASANSSSKLITIEGSPETAKIAESNFKLLKLRNIKLVIGVFDDVLESELKKLNSVDFVFFDGNHRLKPTLTYFEQCLKYAHENSVFIFDDIHWSNEMEIAWNKIKAHHRVTLSIDLFEMGLIFFRKEQEKQNFVLKQ